MTSTSPRRQPPRRSPPPSNGGRPTAYLPDPGAWLTTTANRKAIDRLGRENQRADKHTEAQLLHDHDPPGPPGAIDDDRLRLIFTCCHPALAMQARVALTLRMVGGLTVPEIGRAFLVQETTMGQRITRAKRWHAHATSSPHPAVAHLQQPLRRPVRAFPAG